MKLLTLDDWKNSASSKDNVTYQVECKARFEMYEFARELERYLNNSEHNNFQNYFQKALSIFHRFSHQVSFRQFDRYIYMVASLFLSAKDEDVFNWSLDRYIASFLLLCDNRKEKKLQPYQQSLYPLELPKPPLQQFPQQNPPVFSQEIKKNCQEKLCDAESNILKMLGYDLDIIVPQVYFVDARKKLKLISGDSEKFWGIAQKFLTDLFVTTVVLYYQPKIVCMGAIHLASINLNSQVEDLENKPWYQLFDKDDQSQKPTDLSYEKTAIEDLVTIQKNFEENIKILKY